MWIIFSICASFFAGITGVFAKASVSKVDSSLSTGIRTFIILIFSLIVVLFSSSISEIFSIDCKTFIYLLLSSVVTALLWLVYFKSLELGDINKVTPIDRTSIILTLILSSIFLNEKITIIKIISMLLMIFGTILMTVRNKENTNNKWIIYAILTAILTSLATILSKIGLNDIDSNIASLLRTIIVFALIWIYVLLKKKHKKMKLIDSKSTLFIILSGLSTGMSWLCYFKALQEGEASVVFSVEKLSIVFTIIFSLMFLKEKINTRSIIGLVVIITSIILLL